MSGKKDLAQLVKQIRRQGWHVEFGGRHQRATSPTGAVVTFSVSPSCARAVANVRAELRRHGAQL